jgi:glycerate kinase
VQTNKLETYQSAEYLGRVQEDGRVADGEVAYGSMRFSGKLMPRLRSSKRLCVLLAPDSFKGTITSAEVTRHLSRAVYRHMPLATVVPCLTADGGEGTMDAIICPRDGRYATCSAHDCLGEPINARYGVLPDQTIVIEAATTCGFREQGKKRDIMRSSSFGLGEMIAHVLDHGYRKIEIALGGTAINDGGMGMLCALGVKFLDNAGQPLEGNGENLIRIASVDLCSLHPGISKATLISLCDVQNPLLGETGSSYIYARQKGASDEQIELLERGMTNYAKRTQEATGQDCAAVPGLGAAGGLGYALHVYCKASVASGIETVLQESSFDEQSIQFGKTVQGILNHCQNRNVPLAIISGRSEQGISKLMPVQGWGAITCVHSPITEKFSRENAIPLLDEAADRLFRLLRLGMKLGWKYPILLAEGEIRNENG